MTFQRGSDQSRSNVSSSPSWQGIDALIRRVKPGRAGSDPCSLSESGIALTIGAFDGVHLGHKHVLQQLVEEASRQALASAVMVFRPDPSEFFAGSDAQPALMNWREKVIALSQTGVDQVISVPFNRALSAMSADDFVDQLLIEKLGVRFLMVGDDFRFGARRQGDFAMLERKGAVHGFGVRRSETYLMGGERVSSTRIRHLLASGDLDGAQRLLDKPYQISGPVVRGHQLGRQLGWPTANVPVRRTRVAMTGVFAVVVQLADGTNWPGVANLGIRPAVNSLTRPLLEIHLLDYQGDLYGQKLNVIFCHRLRDEEDFDGLEQLKYAISRDVEKARQYFEKHPVSL